MQMILGQQDNEQSEAVAVPIKMQVVREQLKQAFGQEAMEKIE